MKRWYRFPAFDLGMEIFVFDSFVIIMNEKKKREHIEDDRSMKEIYQYSSLKVHHF